MKSPDQEFGTPVPTWGRPGESGLDGATVSRRTYGQVQMSCYRHLTWASQHCGIYSKELMSDSGYPLYSSWLSF